MGGRPRQSAGTGRPRKGRGELRDQPARTRSRNSHPCAAHTHTLLCENSFSTGTPTLCRAREAQSRWKNSST